MEITVINRLTDFEASLHNPSIFSQLLHQLSEIQKIWKWGALVLALLASFTTIINRFKIFVVRLRQHRSSQLQPLLDGCDFDSDSDDSCSSSSDDEDESEPTSTSGDWRSVDEDFRVRGSDHFVDDQWRSRKFTLRKRRSSIGDLLSWSERSVVSLWDNLGLGLGFAGDDGYDDDEDEKVTSFVSGKYGSLQAVSASSSPAVFVSAEAGASGHVSLSAWDTRNSGRSPVIIAEWKPKKPAEHIAAVNASELQRVYLTDDVTGELTVGDMRRVSSPLRNVTDCEVETWWDADAVIVTGESVDESI